MALCFEFYCNTTGNRVSPITADEIFCKELGTEPNPVDYAYLWMDSIGFALAQGYTADEIYNRLKNNLDDKYPDDHSLMKICEIISERFTVINW